MKKILLGILVCLLLVLIVVELISKTPKGSTSEEFNGMNILINVNDRILKANLIDNKTTKELVEKLKQGSITIDMQDYAGFEKVGTLDFSLTPTDELIKTIPGDIILYQGNKFVIYYGENEYTLTRIGKIEDLEEDLKNILGDGNVTITISLDNQ